jgi:MurNAc alpha-1-phosphate uridylyltransferase
MKAMILAAGRGERMRPLTDTIPKPLLQVGGKPLIAYTVELLKTGGIDEIVVNYAHLGQQIVDYLGDGSEFGVSIRYSDESSGALETGGGILKALNQLDDQPFVVINSDVWTDFPIERLPRELTGLAHLVMVDNPSHHATGDFCLDKKMVNLNQGRKLTFSGIGVYSPRMFDGMKQERFPLVPILRDAIIRRQVTGEYYSGKWMDIGTPQRLQALNDQILAGD